MLGLTCHMHSLGHCQVVYPQGKPGLTATPRTAQQPLRMLACHVYRAKYQCVAKHFGHDKARRGRQKYALDSPVQPLIEDVPHRADHTGAIASCGQCPLLVVGLQVQSKSSAG